MEEFNNIYEYADLKLIELDILNEVRKQLEEMHYLKNNCFVSDDDVDKALEEAKEIYKDMLEKAKEFI